MRFDELLGGVDGVQVWGEPVTVEVHALTLDATQVRPGTLFCCVPGRRADGHDFAPAAVEAGAVALLVERRLDLDVPQAVVPSVRRALGPLASALHGHPSRTLKVVGVTGTNGKTTTTYLLAGIFDAAGMPAGIVGSNTSSRTTPEAPELQVALATMVAEGKRAAAIEVSSAALVASRVDGTRFAAAIFTNLGHDHLGEVHASMEDYFEAKAQLFQPELAEVGVANADDPYGRRLLERAPIPMVPYALADAADLEAGATGSRFRWEGEVVDLRLGGRFNVSNALAAATAARAVGVDAGAIAAGLSSVEAVAGRFETVDAGQPFRVIVDYAHTPEAVEAALAAAREAVAAGGRLTVVFGCGGDRDPAKRPQMGAAAAALADVAVVTSDNPRSEDPEAIIDQVVAGMSDGPARVVRCSDRDVAISQALAEARPGDVVVIAGKGHERGQEIGATVLPFDDREVALGHLRRLGHAS